MKFLDYDNDGWDDILQLNGAMLDNINLYPVSYTHLSGRPTFADTTTSKPTWR